MSRARTRAFIVFPFIVAVIAVLFTVLYCDIGKSPDRHYPERSEMATADPFVPPQQQRGSIYALAVLLRLSAPATAAMQNLGRQSDYATGLIGAAAIPASADSRLSLLLMQPNAADIFSSLYYASDATNEGRLHALRGLCLLKPQDFELIRSRLKSCSQKVLIQTGCIRELLPVSQAVDAICQFP